MLFYLTFTNERMVMIIAAFLFGYCFGCFLFEILRYKNSKDDIEIFFSSYDKKYGARNTSFDRKDTRH